MLRIDEVAGKTFSVTQMREGYEIAEVDEFRTEIVEAITLRDTVINELQEELAAAQMHGAVGDLDSGEAESVRRESSVSAVRLLEIAAVNADQLVADARLESS